MWRGGLWGLHCVDSLMGMGVGGGVLAPCGRAAYAHGGRRAGAPTVASGWPAASGQLAQAGPRRRAVVPEEVAAPLSRRWGGKPAAGATPVGGGRGGRRKNAANGRGHSTAGFCCASTVRGGRWCCALAALGGGIRGRVGGLRGKPRRRGAP